MIYVFTGRQNEGKTLGAVEKIFKDFLDGRTIYSNIPLNFPHILINRDFIENAVKEGTRFKDCSFLLDEFWIWADSRGSARSVTGRMLSYFYLQSSKDNINIYLTAQTGRQNDIRIRENLNVWGECERKVLIDKKMLSIPEKQKHMRKNLPMFLQDRLFIKVTLLRPSNKMVSYTTMEIFKINYLYAKMIFPLYDTTHKLKVPK